RLPRGARAVRRGDRPLARRRGVDSGQDPPSRLPGRIEVGMRFARIDAVLTWIYAACFGLPTIPIAVFHLQTGGLLPWFFDLFPMYGGPWSDRFDAGTFAALLIAFLLVLMASSFAA